MQQFILIQKLCCRGETHQVTGSNCYRPAVSRVANHRTHVVHLRRFQSLWERMNCLGWRSTGSVIRRGLWCRTQRMPRFFGGADFGGADVMVLSRASILLCLLERWRLYVPRSRNGREQSGQVNGFSPEWIRMCSWGERKHRICH